MQQIFFAFILKREMNQLYVLLCPRLFVQVAVSLIKQLKEVQIALARGGLVN